MQIIQTVGKRKTAIARIKLSPSTKEGKIRINKKKLEEYIQISYFKDIVKQPLVHVEEDQKYDIFVNVYGGGIKGQVEAIRLGIARAFCKLNEEYRIKFKPEKLLTRDTRKVERKKYGRRKARRKFQFSKR